MNPDEILQDVITIADLAERFSVTEGSIARWVLRGTLPKPKRIGTLKFWTKTELIGFFDSPVPV